MTFPTVASAELPSAMKGATVSGNFRMHHNSRDYDDRADASAFAFGGGVRAETAPWGLVKIGAGFYTAQDLGLNPDNPDRVDTRMGSDVEVLGEAYLKLSAKNNSLTLGRQKIITPFATPLDIFLVPFTYEGASYKFAGIENLSLELNHINTIKVAGSDEFVDVGIWSTQRLGVDTRSTSGTTMLGINYATETVMFKAWHYTFADLFHAEYFQINYSFDAISKIKPFAAAQFIQQSTAGDGLLGTVESETLGAEIGASIGSTRWMFGYNRVAENTDSFRNGAFIAPYSFASSPLFTNNMLQTMENIDAGESTKLTFFYNLPDLEVKVSYARLDFTSVVDRNASCVDLTYKMDKLLKGLTFRYRAEWVSSASASVSQSDQRLQLQYAF